MSIQASLADYVYAMEQELNERKRIFANLLGRIEMAKRLLRSPDVEIITVFEETIRSLQARMEDDLALVKRLASAIVELDTRFATLQRRFHELLGVSANALESEVDDAVRDLGELNQELRRRAGGAPRDDR